MLFTLQVAFEGAAADMLLVLFARVRFLPILHDTRFLLISLPPSE